jgi:hypothetical protein
MKQYIFIGIIILTLIALFYNLRSKYIEALNCSDDPVVLATEHIRAKVENLNKSIEEQSKQLDVLGGAVNYIVGRMKDFQFSVGSTAITDSGGPVLDISGTIINPILNLTFSQPLEGDTGFSGKIGMYGPRGPPGGKGEMGPDGYWGSLF